jgi:predicted AlkP superfamily pyrophosphatase or phosphodiesterase
MRTFADIPGAIERRLDAGERVVLVLLDAFGLKFLERHDDHPLVRRLDVTPLESQTPSTTTAHIPTLHFGMPVTEHGLYEWNLYEPSLDTVIVPFLFARAGDPPGALLKEGFDVQRLSPGPSLYRRLEPRGIRSATYGPDRIAGSPFGTIALDGSSTHPFPDLATGVSELAAAMSDPEGPHYATLYWDVIDATGHLSGPSSPEFDASIRDALDALEPLTRLDGVTVLFTADHGQVDVAPDRVDYLDELWPELPSFLTQARPAGSARDVFLHVRDPETVIDQLAARLGDRAHVRPAASLFDTIGDRLAARLADVVVLPADGREAWLRSAAGVEQHFRGHHGGLHPDETRTYLAQLLD